MTETAYQIFIHWTIAYCISLLSIGLKWLMGCQQIAPDAVCPTVKGVLGITLIIRRTEMESTVQMFLLPIRDEQAHITRLWQYVECTISTETKRLIPCLVKEWLLPRMPIRTISPVVTRIGEFIAARCWKRVKYCTDSIRLRKHASSQAQGENKWKTIMVGWKVKTVYSSGNFWRNGWIKDYWETANGQEMWQDNQRHHLCARGNASDAYHKSFIWSPENIWSLIIFDVLPCCTILPLRSCHQKIQEYKIIYMP